MSKKKEEILEVATVLFAKNGFENTSVAHICKEANVSKGLIYHHFKSKEAILLEIYTDSTNKMVEINKQANADVGVNNQLMKIIDSLFEELENDKTFFQFNLNMMFQPSTKKLLEKQIKERASILFKTVKNIFDKISPINSEIRSYIFIAELDGIALNYLSSYDNYPLAKIKEELIKKYMTIN